MNYSTKEIAEITQSQIIGDKNLQIHHIAFDSRNIYSTLKTAFIAINTHKNSGEKYISQAIEKGIKVIISENFYSEYDGITWIIVENSVKFLQDLAHFLWFELHNNLHPIQKSLCHPYTLPASAYENPLY